MAWPAKYFTTSAEPETVAASIGTVWTHGEQIAPDDVPARGYQGFHFAYQFNLKGTPAYLLAIREGDVSKVVTFGIPSVLGKAKFVKSLESAVAAVPGAQPAKFPGRSGDLKFL